jgi:hypothetical protein
MANRHLSCSLVLVLFACTGVVAQKRPSILIVGDDCDKGVATQAVVSSFRDASTASQRWSEGNEKAPQTPEIFIQCWNVDGESFVVTSFGFTISGDKAMYDKPKLWLARSPENGRQLGVAIFKEWEQFWQGKK